MACKRTSGHIYLNILKNKQFTWRPLLTSFNDSIIFNHISQSHSGLQFSKQYTFDPWWNLWIQSLCLSSWKIHAAFELHLFVFFFSFFFVNKHTRTCMDTKLSWVCVFLCAYTRKFQTLKIFTCLSGSRWVRKLHQDLLYFIHIGKLLYTLVVL